MNDIRAVAIVVLALTIVGCQSSSARSRPPYLPEGLKVHFPMGDGWRAFDFRREGVLFGKKDFSNGKTSVASTELLRTSYVDSQSTDRYLAYIRHNLLAESRKRGEVTSFVSVLGHVLGEYCVETHVVLISNEDDSPPDAPFIEESHVLMCLHPQSKNHLYRFMYSERTKEKDLSKTLRQDAHSFFSGVEFHSVAEQSRP